MALARPQGPVGSGGLKAAAIGFAVTAVAAITFTIIMFTQRSDLQAAADQAMQQAQQRQKAESQAKQDLSDLAQEVIGRPAGELAEVKTAIEPVRKQVTDNELVKKSGVKAEQPVAIMLGSLYRLFQATAEELSKLQATNKELNDKLDSTLKEAKAKSDAFEAQIGELTTKFQDLTKQSEEFRNTANARQAELQTARTKEREDAAKELDAARKAKEEAEKTLQAERKRAEELLNQLAQFKPSAQGGSALQVKDGTIVRIVPDGDVTYIDLGRRDRIKPGMTFSVYSPVRGIPADGKGKATVEVANVFESTSECRITSREAGEPVLAGDIIANPVYDRSRQYRFAVAGDFDLNFDGKVDLGGREVSRLIERLGGKVVNRVDSDTDFLVLGSAPPAPAPIAPGAENEAAVAERNAELTLRRQAFEAMFKEARALSIPILTRTQFLHFVGQSMPKNTPDDALPEI
jgi:hypothetical protein